MGLGLNVSAGGVNATATPVSLPPKCSYQNGRMLMDGMYRGDKPMLVCFKHLEYFQCSVGSMVVSFHRIMKDRNKSRLKQKTNDAHDNPNQTEAAVPSMTH